jgi:hypothetical protein
MSDIHYLYGSRIQTPSTANNNQVQLGDTNNDGVIDILDAGDVTSGLIWDANNDGTIDILDAAEINANGGIPNTSIITNVDTENDLLKPFSIVKPDYCTEQPPSEPRFTFNTQNGSPGIITTGCNSIYNVDGTINWPPNEFDDPDNPFFCPEGKMRGFCYDGTGGVSYQDQCTCVEAGVGAAQIAMLGFFGGPGKDAGKNAAKQVLKRTIATAEDSLEKALKYRRFLDTMLESALNGKKTFEKAAADLYKRISALKQAQATGFHPSTGEKVPTEMIPKLQPAIDLLERELRITYSYLATDAATIEKIIEEMKRFDDIIAAAKKTMDNMKPLLDDLDHFDPEKWISLIFGTLVPISQFFVPKECASNQELDDECNCVNKPIVSGSYSPSNLNLQIPNNYNIVESL